MNKKLLTSLMMTPLAFGAMANINVVDNILSLTWTQTGVTGDTPIVTIDGVNCPITGGEISHTFNLYPGKYKLTFTKPVNVKAVIDGKEYEVVGGTTPVEFTVGGDEAKDVTLTFKSGDATQGFSFKSFQFELVFDFKAASEYLVKTGSNLAKIIPAIENPADTALRNDSTSYIKAIFAAREVAHKFATGTIAAYSNNRLWKYVTNNYEESGDNVSLVYQEYTPKVEALKADIETANAAYQEQKAKDEYKATCDKYLTNLNNTLNYNEGKASDSINAIPEGQASRDAIVAYAELYKANIHKSDTALIVEYSAYIDQAYKDGFTDEQKTYIESQYNAIAKVLNQFPSEIESVITRAKNYAGIREDLADLDKNILEGQSKLMNLQGVNEYKDSFNDSISTWQNEFPAEYTELRAAIEKAAPKALPAESVMPDSVAGAINELTQDIYNQAIKDYNQATGNIASFLGKTYGLLTEQNNRFTTDYDKIAKINTNGFPEETTAQLDTLKRTLIDTYLALQLPIEDFDKQLANATANFAGVTKVIEGLDSLKVEIGKLPELLQNKFESTVKNIEDAIAAITPNTNLDDITDAISSTQDNVTKLGTAYKDTEGALAAHKAVTDSLTADFIKINLFDDTDAVRAQLLKDSGYAAFLQKYVDNEAKLDSVCAVENPEECFTGLTKFAAELTESAKSYKGEAASVLAKYASLAAQMNKNYVQTVKANEVATALKPETEEPYFGYDKVDEAYKAIQTAIMGITTTIPGTTTDVVDAANKIYSNLEDQVEALDQLLEDIKQYKANQTTVDGWNTTLEAQTALLEAATTANDKTIDPAKIHFAQLIDKYTSTQDSLVTAVDALLKAGIAEGNITEEKQKETTEAIDALVKNVKALENITTNYDKYKGLLGEAESTRNAIESVETLLKTLTAEGNTPKEYEETINRWEKSIQDLYEQLLVLNRSVTESYGEGKCYTQVADFDQQYDAIQEAADKLKTDINTEFQNDVATANEAYLEKWKAEYTVLRNAYITSIDAFNRYSTIIDNPGFKKYLSENVEELGNHEPIYKYSDLITELDKTVRAYIDQHSIDKKVITDTMYKEVAKDPADLYETEMADMVSKMKTDVANASETFYNTIIAQANAKVQGDIDTMTAAGVSQTIADEYAQNAKDVIAAQEKVYNDAMNPAEGAEPKDIAETVNTIANDLDRNSQPLTVDTEGAAQAQWTLSWGDDKKQLDKWATEIAGFKYVAGDENIGKFNTAQSEIEAMSGTATLADLKTMLDELQTEYEAAEAAYNALKAKNDAAVEAEATEAELYANVAELESDNTALEEWAADLAGTYTDNITQAIEDIKNDIEESTDIVADKSTIETSIENVKGNIDKAYAEVATSEKDELNKLMYKLRLAYNDARAAGKFDNDSIANAINEVVDSLQIRVDALPTGTDFNLDDKDEFKAEAKTLEQEISDMLLDLQSRVDSENTTLTQTLTALNEQYEKVYSDVNAGKEGLGDDVKAEYTSKYDDLLKELEAIKTAIGEKGASVVLYRDKYASDIQAVADDLEALNQAAANAQAEADAKKAIEEATAKNVEALDAEITAARAAVEQAKTQVTEWGVAEWTTYLESLNTRLNKIQEEVAAQAVINDENPDGITADEKKALSDAIASVDTEREYYVEQAATQYADEANTKARNAISEAFKALTGVTVVNSSEISQNISARSVALETATNELNTALEAAETLEDKIAAYEDFVSKTEEIRAALEAIQQEIKDGTYTLGDVDGNGEPNISDLQTLIKWIGEGMTMQDIKTEYGVAIAAAADITGDGRLSVGDITALINIIMNEDSQDKPTRIVTARSTDSSAIYSLSRTGEENGSRIYSLDLINSGDFIAAQVDIKLPVGMTLMNADMSERASGHEIQIFDNGNGNYRLLVYSMQNAIFQGSTGELIQLHIEGIGTPEVESMELATPGHATVYGQAADTNMIESIIEGAHNMKERIYNAAGQSLRAVQRGINIIRHSDGTTTKEMHK